MVSVIVYMVLNVWYLSCCLFVYAVFRVVAGAVEFKGVVSIACLRAPRAPVSSSPPLLCLWMYTNSKFKS